MMRSQSLLGLLVITQSILVSHAANENLWRVVDDDPESKRDLGEVTEAMARIQGGMSISLDSDSLDWEEDEFGFVYLSFLLPTQEEPRFKLRRTDIMHPSLGAKYPEILTFSGESVNFSRLMVADVDYSPEGGVHALIRDGTRNEYYIDPYVLSEGMYKVYSGRVMTNGVPWSCNVHGAPNSDEDTFIKSEADGDDTGVAEDAENESNYSGRRLRHAHGHYHKHGNHTLRRGNYSRTMPQHPDGVETDEDEVVRPRGIIGANQYKFTLAIMTNGQYSRYHGNTIPSILASIVTTMNRVNGIFKRDLGLFFELHEDTDKLICLYPCADLPNDSSILSNMRTYITNRGVRPSTYDIGHSFTTGSGGVAYLRSMCGYWKAGGTTGLSSPTADVFYVDYVSHEIGHQINGQHSFSDCNGHYESPERYASPVEPGSGSTIMGYAGICGSTNIQYNSDPIFHAKNAEEIMSFIESKAQGGCGTIVKSSTAAPVAILPTKCTIPAGNYFQIAFKKPDPELFYSIEPVDEALSRPLYSDRSISKFRSWMPTNRPYRNFPNLYYIIHDMDRGLASNAKDEVIPYNSVNMTFRGTVRTLFSKAAQKDDHSNTGGFGMRSFNDVAVSFKEMNPLYLPYDLADDVSLFPGQKLSLTWEVGGTKALSSRVQILLAKHDPQMDFKSGKLDYVNQIVPLEWVLVTETNNDGSQEITIPKLPGVNGKADVHLMIRSTDDFCFFFDLVAFIEYDTAGTTPVPNPGPVPTPEPTAQAPTISYDEWSLIDAECAKYKRKLCKAAAYCSWTSSTKCSTNVPMPPREEPEPEDEEIEETEEEFCAQFLKKKLCKNAIDENDRPTDEYPALKRPRDQLTPEEIQARRERRQKRIAERPPNFVPVEKSKGRCTWSRSKCVPS